MVSLNLTQETLADVCMMQAPLTLLGVACNSQPVAYLIQGGSGIEKRTPGLGKAGLLE